MSALPLASARLSRLCLNDLLDRDLGKILFRFLFFSGFQPRFYQMR